MNPRLSVIIPAYNEAKRLPATLVSIVQFSKTISYQIEVIVVVNNTTDDTVKVAEAMKDTVPNLTVIDIGMHQSESGTKGLAVKEGMLRAQGEYAVYMDADNATSIEAVEAFWIHFSNGADVVFGSRAIARSHVRRVWYRAVAAWGANILIQSLLLPKVRDSQCGFKCFTAASAKAIFSRTTIPGWGFDLEVLAIARSLGSNMVEAPVRWKEVGHTSLKASAFFTTLKELFSIRKNLKRKVYDRG